jgi:high-affinity iron transporter
MLPSYLLSLREGLEAALIIGIILGALHKLHRSDLKPVVWRGVGLAVTLSILAGLGLNLLGMEFEGVLEEAFEGIAMLLAAGILTWMILCSVKVARFGARSKPRPGRHLCKKAVKHFSFWPSWQSSVKESNWLYS